MAGGIAKQVSLIPSAGIGAAVPETWTLSAGEIRAWLATAKAGDQMVYACERHLSRFSDGAKLARTLEEQRFATLFHKPIGGGIKQYIIRRLKIEKGSIGRSPAPRRARLDGDMARVLRVLRDCARHGQPCPQNRELGQRASVQNPSYQIQKLVAGGFILSRIVDAAKGLRVITILASGVETAEPRG